MRIEKPWGFEQLLEKNSSYVLKKLFMKKDHRCSLQFHREKKETVYVLEGNLNLHIGPTEDNLDIRVMNPGDFITISPGEIHRMEGLTDCLYLESSTPELDDVVRLLDDYDRK